MVFISFELVDAVGMMATVHLMMAEGEMAPGGSAEGAAQAAAVVGPGHGAAAGFDQDGTHVFVRFGDWSINHVSSVNGEQPSVKHADNSRGEVVSIKAGKL
jgi:hypothetical protein